MIKTSATLPVQFDTCFSPFHFYEFDTGLEWVKDNGFDGVELVISKPLEVDINFLNKKLYKLSLEVSTIATGQSVALEGISLTDDSETVRKKAVDRIIEHINLSTELVGRPNVTIGLIRGKGDSGSKNILLDIFKKELIKCIDYAARKNIVLNLEPINRYETVMLNSCDDTLDFLKMLGSPKNTGILYDTFHSNIEDADMLNALQKIKGNISHVHFADSNRHLPGKGHIDFKSIYKKLAEIKYDGYVSIETLNLPDSEDIKKNAGKAMKSICCNI